MRKGSRESKKPALCPTYSNPADEKKDPKLGRPPPSGGRKVLGERTNLCDPVQSGGSVQDGNKIGGCGDKIGNMGGNFGGGDRKGRRLRGGGGVKVKHRAVSEPRPPSTKESNETGETSYHLPPLSFASIHQCDFIITPVCALGFCTCHILNHLLLNQQRISSRSN